MLSETSGDFVVPEQPARVPTNKSVEQSYQQFIGFFMFLFSWG
jgi:hypothetical protein